MAFDMHIKFGKGKVTIGGSSDHAKHKDEVPVLAWSWGLSNSADLHNSSVSAGGKAHVQDISLTKYVDSSSHSLLQAAATGARIEEAWLYVTNATGEQTDYVTIHLSNGVMVTSVSTGGSGGEDRLTENVTLHFGKFKYGFQPQKPDGTKDGAAKEFTYDIQAVASA
ncbi:type VI secretion system tube protein Hcp [Luteimonas sp. BDR2-5]|uniref:Hcp family type VI secretion system effector n=1 Tax=Proluteimonas luteida TaxID=2878685 RepID=UPI001E2D806A|nr:type VI secretion system tube protein Hcp [Luteimonas sp. BDR2-5]